MKSPKDIKADYQLFMDIQITKFLKLSGQNEFKDKNEAEIVLKNIIEAYNDKIATDHLRLDNLNDEAKAAWFNTVELNYTKPTGTENEDLGSIFSDDIGDLNGEEMNDEKFEIDSGSLLEHMGKHLDFLPEGSTNFLILGIPLLDFYGYPFEKFKDVITGKRKAKMFEKDIFNWVVDTTLAIVASEKAKTKKEREMASKDALDFAGEYLDKDDAKSAIEEIKIYIDEEMGFKKSKKGKSGKKPKK